MFSVGYTLGPPKWGGRTGGAGDGGERGGSGMKGNRCSFIVNFTSTLLPDTDQHVQILKLHCMFLKLSDQIYRLILTTSNHILNKTWCSVSQKAYTNMLNFKIISGDNTPGPRSKGRGGEGRGWRSGGRG